jgi:hypothetical protein
MVSVADGLRMRQLDTERANIAKRPRWRPCLPHFALTAGGAGGLNVRTMATSADQPPADQPPKDVIGFLDFYLVQKAPFQLPDGLKEGIVRYGPWIAIVLLVLALPPLLFLLGLGTLLIPFGGVAYATGFTYLTILVIVEIGLMIAALPGLFARKMSGWRLLLYSQIVSIVASILSGAIVGGILFGLIGLYLLFQVRPLYTS